MYSIEHILKSLSSTIIITERLIFCKDWKFVNMLQEIKSQSHDL